MTRIRTAKDFKRGELTAKDMSVVREADAAKVQRETRRATLRDWSLSHRIELRWDLNPEAERDQIFRMRVDDYEVLIDSEELLRILRWV